MAPKASIFFTALLAAAIDGVVAVPKLAPRQTTSATSEPSSIAAGGKLDDLAVAAGLDYFGTATLMGELENSTYASIINDTGIFGQITPGNEQKVRRILTLLCAGLTGFCKVGCY